jgi:hypothetical protein
MSFRNKNFHLYLETLIPWAEPVQLGPEISTKTLALGFFFFERERGERGRDRDEDERGQSKSAVGGSKPSDNDRTAEDAPRRPCKDKLNGKWLVGVLSNLKFSIN